MSITNGSEGRLKFGFGFQPKAERATRSRRNLDEPFRILLLADLSGRSQRNIADIADLNSRPCLRVDLDEYDSILMKYAPRIDWPIGQLNFKELDDFHPDQLFNQLEIFKFLRETRKRLKDPGTFSDTARQLRSEKPVEFPLEKSTSDVKPEGDVFSRLLGKPSIPSQQPKSSQPADAVSSMIREIVGPYIVPAADPRADQYISSVDMAIADQMRAILHHRDFQVLEATWRGIWDLVTSLELDENLELFLLDVTKQELYLDISTHMTDLSASGLYKQMADKWIGGLDSGSWSVIVGHYDFEYSEQDIGLLAGLGILSSHAGAPFLADANASLIGCKSFAQYPEPSEWVSDLPLFENLRKSSVSSWIGLAAPRVLMRLPYGKRSDEIEAFHFEELSGAPNHEHFLWGSSAVACAKLLGMAFNRKGWAFTLEDCLNLEGLPSYPIHTESGSELKPCAEVFMSDRIGDEISQRGFIVLMSYKNRNAVKIRNWQSISDPAISLSGPWE
jgi:type VI secretion system protein ImpC